MSYRKTNHRLYLNLFKRTYPSDCVKTSILKLFYKHCSLNMWNINIWKVKNKHSSFYRFCFLKIYFYQTLFYSIYYWGHFIGKRILCLVNKQHIAKEKFLFFLSQNVLMDFIKALLLSTDENFEKQLWYLFQLANSTLH